MKTDPLKITLQLTGYKKQLFVRADGPTGEARAETSFPTGLPLADLTEIDPARISPLTLQSVGKSLYQCLLSGEVASLVTDVVQDGRHLKQSVHFELRFDADQVELTQYPWEIIANDFDQFLVRDGLVNLTRYISYPQPPPSFELAFQQKPLLQVVAEPTTLQALHIVNIGLPKLESLRHATFTMLQEYILLKRKDFWGLHFDGHGSVMLRCYKCSIVNLPNSEFCHQCGVLLSNAKKVGALAFELNGDVEWIPVDEFGSLLFNSKAQLAVLSACETAVIGNDLLFSGLAPGLILAGVPAVIGMQFPVLDSFANRFTQSFYEALLTQNDLLAAFQTARRMNVRGAWYSPVLYLRARQNSGLFKPKSVYHTRNIDTATPAEVQVAIPFLVRFWIRRPETKPLSHNELRQELGIPRKISLNQQETEAEIKFKPVEGRKLRQGEVEVSLQSIACDITPKVIKLFIDEFIDAPPAIFTVTAREVGQIPLIFSVWQDAGQIVSVSHKIHVVTQELRSTTLLESHHSAMILHDELENQISTEKAEEQSRIARAAANRAIAAAEEAEQLSRVASEAAAAADRAIAAAEAEQLSQIASEAATAAVEAAISAATAEAIAAAKEAKQQQVRAMESAARAQKAAKESLQSTPHDEVQVTSDVHIDNVSTIAGRGLTQATYQDLRRFLTQHHRLLFAIIVLETPLGILFFQYKDRYLISWFAYLLIALLLAVAVWSWGKVLSAWSSRFSIRIPLLLAIILTIIWSGFMLFQIRGRLAPSKIAVDKFGIAIATFGEGNHFRVTPRARQLNDLTRRMVVPRLWDVVEVRSIGVIQNAEQAKLEGQRIGAKLVIWGHILEGNECSIIYLQVLEVAGFTDDAVVPRVLPIVNPSSSGSTNICDTNPSFFKEKIPQQLLGLTAFSLGLYHLDEQMASRAAEQFELALDALQSSQTSNNKTNLGLIYYYLGKSYQLQGNYEDSQTMLEQASLLNPSDPAVVLEQAYNYRAMGEEVQKQEAIRQVFNLIYQRPRDDLTAIYDRALAYEILNNDELAWHTYQAILQCNRELLVCQSTFFPAYLNAGRVLLNLNRFDEAHMIYNRAAELAKGNADMEAWLNVEWGQLYAKVGKVDDAIQSYTSAIALKPTLATPYLYRARLYEQISATYKAILDYKKFVELSDNRGFAHVTFAEFLYWQNRYDESIEYYNEALNYPIADKALIHAYIGRSFAAIREKERALAEFAMALETSSPSESYIRSIYGIALANFGHFDEAINQMELSLKLNQKTDIVTTLNLGQLYEAKGELDKAKALYISLLALDSQVPNDKQQIILERLKNLQTESTPKGSKP